MRPMQNTRRIALSVAALVIAAGVAWGGTQLWEARLHQPALDHYRRGAKLQADGDPEAAVVEWQAAAKLEPAWPEPHLRMADTLRENGRNDLAVQALRLTLKQSPKATHVLCRIADNYAELGDTLGAAGWSEEAVRQEPNCARAHQLYAQTHRGKDLGEATRHLQRARELAPADRGILLDLVRLHTDAGNLPEAEKVLLDGMRGQAYDAETHHLAGMLRGRRARTPQEYAEAADHLRQAIRLNPDGHAAYAELGLLYERERRWKDARAQFEQAYRLNPYAATILFHLATIYRQLGDPRAEATWDHVRALQAKTKRWEELRKRLAKAPQDTDLTLQTAELSREIGGFDLARTLAQSVLNREPGNTRAQRLLVSLLPTRAAKTSAP